MSFLSPPQPPKLPPMRNPNNPALTGAAAAQNQANANAAATLLTPQNPSTAKASLTGGGKSSFGGA